MISSVESSPKLPDAIDPTVAAGSIKEHTATLVKVFRHSLSSLADSLYSQSIISEDIHRKAQNKSLDEDERSRALVSCVEARLDIEPSDFKKFVDILNAEPFFGTLGSKLVQSYCTLSSVPTATKCPATICHYAAYLKGVYRNSPISPDSKWPPTPSKKYINLATVAHGYRCRDEFVGHILHGSIDTVLESRKEISIDEILKPDEEGVDYLKLILIDGAPGIGKSTLAWELCRRWERGCMEKYSLTILLRLREKEVQKIGNIAELFYSYQGEDKSVLIREITSRNGKEILFILDGFDELPIDLQKEGFLVNLIRGTLLPECTVLVTSRPSATAKLLTICRPQIQKHIEVLGFTQESVVKYATSIFSSEPERLIRFLAFISASENPAINSLMCIPLNAAIIVEIYRHSKCDDLLPCTLTQAYTQLSLTILNRHLQSNQSTVVMNSFKDLPGHSYQEFLKLSEVAFDGMKMQEIIFHTLPSDLVHFGFLDAVSSLYGGDSTSYNFLHLTLQEFFAAYHISQLCGDARLRLLRECGSDSHWNVVWGFVAGLTELKFFEGQLESDLFVVGNKDVVKVKSLFVQCLFEAHIKMGRADLFGHKNIEFFDLGSTRTPLDWYALGYCIANLTSEVSWDVYCGNLDCISGLCLANGLSTSNNYSNISKLHCFFTRSLPDLEYLPLCAITKITCHNFYPELYDYLSTFLPCMTSLKQLVIWQIGVLEDLDVFLQQLSQTNVTSFSVKNTDITKCISALQPLIDPQTGTLEELCIEGILNVLLSILAFNSTLFPLDDTALLDMVCAPSSLKSLTLLHPQNISSLTQLGTNTCLTKLVVRYDDEVTIPHETVKVIAGILEHNKTLEHLTVGKFVLPKDIIAIKDIIEARNSTLKCIEVVIYHPDEDFNASDFMKEKYPELNDPRISWETHFYLAS